MPSCPRVVFLIDENQSINERNKEKILSNIHLSCLRTLSYFAHKFCHAGIKSSVLWGYKFYNSAKSNVVYRYKQYPFLDHTISNFNSFETELYERLECHADITSVNAGENSAHVAHGNQLKSAMTDVLTEFQWDRPELFSPTKKLSCRDHSYDVDIMNIVFLFTPCPYSRYQKNYKHMYFNAEYDDASSFIKLLFPGVLYEKFLNQSKITLCWVDTGFCSQLKTADDPHKIMKEGMKAIKSCVIPVEHLSMWWAYGETTVQREKTYVDIISTSSLIQDLLPITSQNQEYVTNFSNCQLIMSEDSGIDIILCSATKNKTNTRLQYIKIKDTIQLKNISLQSLSSREGPFFYFIKPTGDSDMEVHNLIKESLNSKMAMNIELCFSKSSTKLHGIMIPCTNVLGTIIIFNNKDNKELKNKVIISSADVSTVVSKVSGIMEKQNFGTSIANIADSWFFYNPNLGFSSSLKEAVKTIHNSGTEQSEAREENSKKIIEYFKAKFSKENNGKEKKTKMKGKLKKASRMKGMSWARWRLLEYRRQMKQKEKDSVKKGEEVLNVSVDEITKKIPVETVVLPEFSSDQELTSHLLVSYERLLGKSYLSHTEVELCVKTTVQHVSKNAEAATTRETVIDFLKGVVLFPLVDIREKYSNLNKEKLVQEYLLQVHILLECAVLQTNEDKEDNDLKKLIASFLRSVSFEENTFFLRNHLKTVILPSFAHRLPELLYDIYEDMMLEIPKELRKEEEEAEDNSSPAKQVQLPSSISCYSSDETSISSLQSEKRTFKRHPSVVGDNSNKRMISVQMKKKANAKKSKKKEKKQSVANGATDEKVVRSLFDEGFSLPAVPVTPTSKRRHSEPNIRTKVPNTPEYKQINDMMWKKQDRERRHSQIDKRMEPIEESPLKEWNSPCKKKRSFFHRSKSFGCHTSPRRFYALKRHPTSMTNTDDKSENEADTTWKRSPKKKSDACCTPLQTKLRRRNTLLSNFVEDHSSTVADNKGILSEMKNSGIDCSEQFDDTTLTSRSIFCGRGSSETSCTNTLSVESAESFSQSESLKRHHSPINRCTKKMRFDDKNDKDSTQLEMLPYDVSREKDFDVSENSEQFPKRSLFGSDTAVDWLREIEKEQTVKTVVTPVSLTFRDAFHELSKASAECAKQSPTIMKSISESITGSPCLSAGSLECLENAPILSPVGSKRKLRRRRMLAPEYDER